MQGNELSFLEFIGCHGLDIFPISFGCGFSIVHHEWQLKNFHAWESTCRVARQSPNNVDHAVPRLVVQLHRRAAQLHGGISFKFDASARVLFDLVHPCFVHVEPHIGLRGHEGVKLQSHSLLGKTCQGWRCDGGCGT